MKNKTSQLILLFSLIGCLVLGIMLVPYCGGEKDRREAARTGDLARVKALIAAKEDVNAKYIFGRTALMYASSKGHIEVVRALLAAKADVNAKSNDGCTALIWASARGNVEVVKALLAAKADVNAKANNGLTALMNAQKNKGIMALIWGRLIWGRMGDPAE